MMEREESPIKAMDPNHIKSKDQHDSFKTGYSQFKAFTWKCFTNLNSLEDMCYYVKYF